MYKIYLHQLYISTKKIFVSRLIIFETCPNSCQIFYSKYFDEFDDTDHWYQQVFIIKIKSALLITTITISIIKLPLASFTSFDWPNSVRRLTVSLHNQSHMDNIPSDQQILICWISMNSLKFNIGIGNNHWG